MLFEDTNNPMRRWKRVFCLVWLREHGIYMQTQCQSFNKCFLKRCPHLPGRFWVCLSSSDCRRPGRSKVVTVKSTCWLVSQRHPPSQRMPRCVLLALFSLSLTGSVGHDAQDLHPKIRMQWGVFNATFGAKYLMKILDHSICLCICLSVSLPA